MDLFFKFKKVSKSSIYGSYKIFFDWEHKGFPYFVEKTTNTYVFYGVLSKKSFLCLRPQKSTITSIKQIEFTEYKAQNFFNQTLPKPFFWGNKKVQQKKYSKMSHFTNLLMDEHLNPFNVCGLLRKLQNTFTHALT